MNLQGLLNEVAASFFSRGVDAVVGRAEWIVRVGDKLHHRKVCYVHEVLSIVVAPIYGEALFNRTDVIVLCSAYLRLE